MTTAIVSRPRRVVEHNYTPRGACKTLFESRAGEILLSGPAGTGKSRGCLEKLLAQVIKYPGMKGLILRKTAASLGASALDTWDKYVIKEALAAGKVSYFGGSTKEPACYRFTNGSRVVVGGMDNPVKIMSTEYDVIYMQEAIEFSEADWESATSRLRNGRMPYQQLMADTNPERPTHWLKVRSDKGDTLLVESRHEDNPVYFDDKGNLTPAGIAYIQGKLDKLTGVRKQRLRYGKWVGAEGLIYEDYDTTVHLIDRMPAGWETWPRYWSIDWGFTNPIVVQFWAEDPDGRLYLYREIYHTQCLVEDVAKQVMDIVAPKSSSGERVWIEPQPQAIICDHDAEDRFTFERHTGLGTTPAHKTVSTGIQAVQTRFCLAGDGKPRIYILRNALVKRDESLADARRPVCTEQEIPGYVWKKGLDGRPVPEEPVKENDHGCDAKRYLVVHRESGSNSYFRGWLD